MGEFASKGVAGSGLGLGIAGTALGLLNANGNGGGLLGGLLAAAIVRTLRLAWRSMLWLKRTRRSRN